MRQETRDFFDSVSIRKARRDKDGKVTYESIYKYKPIPDETIKKLVESVPDCKLVYIIRYLDSHKKVAYVNVPNDVARKDGLAFAHKSKGLFAPDKFDIDLGHKATPEEMSAVDIALGKANGKKTG